MERYVDVDDLALVQETYSIDLYFIKYTMYLIKKISYIWSLLVSIFRPKLLILPIISGVLTSICLIMGYTNTMNIATTFFFIGTFFVFSVVMNTVNNRRFLAIHEMYTIKSNIFCIYETALVQKIAHKKDRTTATSILKGICIYLTCDDPKKDTQNLVEVDSHIQALLQLGERLRKNGLSAPEMSRLQQQVAFIRTSFEKLMSIKENRTPKSLKLFTYLSLPLSTIILAPAFATLGIIGIPLSIIVAFLLGLLVIIENDLEDPFNQDIDDVQFDFIERFEKRLESL